MEPIKEINLDKLSREEQKVIIAKDVIANITANKYMPRRGSYIKSVETEEGYYYIGRDNPQILGDIKSRYDELKNCEVCAIGACILSITKYKNQLKFEDIPDKWQDNKWKKVINLLLTVFTKEELATIEYMFESDNICGTLIEEHEEVDKYQILKEEAREFSNSYDDSESRLIAIMTNIIDNNGSIVLTSTN